MKHELRQFVLFFKQKAPVSIDWNKQSSSSCLRLCVCFFVSLSSVQGQRTQHKSRWMCMVLLSQFVMFQSGTCLICDKKRFKVEIFEILKSVF